MATRNWIEQHPILWPYIPIGTLHLAAARARWKCGTTKCCGGNNLADLLCWERLQVECPSYPLTCLISSSQPCECISVEYLPFSLQMSCHFIEEVGACLLLWLPSYLEDFWCWCRLSFMFTIFWAFHWESEKAEALSDAFLYVHEILGMFSLFNMIRAWGRAMRIFNVKLSDFCSWVWQQLGSLLLSSLRLRFLSIHKSKVCRSFKF